MHIPIDLYPATETQGISSNLLHKKDHSRNGYQRVSEAAGKEVPAEEIVRGYEIPLTVRSVRPLLEKLSTSAERISLKGH